MDQVVCVFDEWNHHFGPDTAKRFPVKGMVYTPVATSSDPFGNIYYYLAEFGYDTLWLVENFRPVKKTDISQLLSFSELKKPVVNECSTS